MIILTATCPFCGCINEVAVYEDDYIKWRKGASAQKSFPYLTPNEREIIISGICPDCWDKMFGAEN